VNSFEGSPNYLWAIVAKDTSLGHIGNISAYVDKFNQVADVGILIGEKACWGKGSGSEAWKAVLDFLIFELKLRKVTAGTMSLNQGMINIALKCGMKEEGRRKSQFLYNGSEADLVMFALFRAVC
jgi:RimJ/RimL family protein N-acetyltransferase